MGDVKSFQITIDQPMVDQFAQMSGDKNPIHIDPEVGSRSEFQGRIAHGALLLAQVSRMLGMELPGPGCVITAMEVRFPTPLKPPAKIIVQAQMAAYNSERRDGKVNVTVNSSQGIHVQANVHFIQYHQDGTKTGKNAALEQWKISSEKSKFESRARKKLLITGGTGGIGLEVLKKLNSQYDCFTTTRKETAETKSLRTYKIDLESESDLEGLLTSLDPREFFGIIHMSSPKPLRAKLLSDASDLKRQFYHSLDLPIRLARWADQPHSTVRRMILIGSTYGSKALELSIPSYSLAKSVMGSLAQLLAAEFSRLGATINVIAPGFVPLGMNAGVPQRKQTSLEGLTPTGRLTAPSDIAATIEFLLSDAASQINGATIIIDGGFVTSSRL